MKNDNTETRDENGFLHSYDDKPALITYDGSLYWYQHGNQHRDNGPAVIYCDGTKLWFKNDLPHREDGAAIEYIDGDKDWALEGTFMSFEEWINKTNIGETKKAELLLSN